MTGTQYGSTYQHGGIHQHGAIGIRPQVPYEARGGKLRNRLTLVSDGQLTTPTAPFEALNFSLIRREGFGAGREAIRSRQYKKAADNPKSTAAIAHSGCMPDMMHFSPLGCTSFF
jgi:hypothetical protein